MSRNKRYQENENAVSPIIGVLLMVVITVVLAATIAMFSFNLSDSTKRIDNVAVKVERVNATHIVVKFMGSVEKNSLLFDPPGVPGGYYGETPTGYFGTFNVSLNGNEVSNFVPKGVPNCTSNIGSMQYFSPVPLGSEINVIANYKSTGQNIVWQGIV